MHRFFVSAESLRENHVTLKGPQSRQIYDVLRMKSGDKIIVLDNTNYEYTVELDKVGREEASGRVVDSKRCETESKTRITLYQSLLARDKFELVLQKCTETGVVSFVPVVTQRCIIRRADTVTDKKASRWKSIITEAAEQSGRGRIPQLEDAISFSDAVSGLDSFDCCLIGSLEPNEPALREILRTGNIEPVKIALFIGPEGGFSKDEIALARSKGAVSFSLGRRILRTETAAVVASALILYELDR